MNNKATKTKPLPPIAEDPTIIRAQQIAPELHDKFKAIRSNRDLSDLAKARQVVEAYNAAMAERSRLWEDLQGRRSARLQELQTLLPFGPGIPEGTSPADAAVMQAAFRSNVEMARESDMPGLRALLFDAVRFGDELMRRAVYTVATDQGRTGVVWRDLREADPTLAAVAEEIGVLVAQLNGTHTATAGWERRAFWAIAAPDEVHSLPTLERLAAVNTNDPAPGWAGWR